MEHGTAYFNNLLLDNIDLPIDITLVSTPKEVSTPSLLITVHQKVCKIQKLHPPRSLISLKQKTI